ncbi:MAG: serine hydrolase [Bacteroides sp.]|nr:serine hydrolase [Bacteroides sp.]
MRKSFLFLLASLLTGMLAVAQPQTSQQSTTGTEPALLRALQHDGRCTQWVDSVLQTLRLKERVGQLFIYTIAPQQTQKNRDLLRKVVQEYKVGGLLFSAGRMENQVALTNEAQRMAEVPLMITFDGEWGLSMRLKGTPTFPRNMALGCVQNDSLLYAYGREMARQCRKMGVQVNFAPVADVNINPENPVINTRSFGESPELVAQKVLAYARGLEDGGVLSVVKHFPGHGDTDVDSHKALPTLPFSRERLDSIELHPFRRAIGAGLSGVMVGHLEVPSLEPKKGLPASLSRNVVTRLLQEELGFRGLVFTDALAMKGVSNNDFVCLQALKAGHDMLLVPRRIKEDVEAVMAALKRGELDEADITRRCRKVLTYKYALGLEKKPRIRLSGLEQRLDTEQTRELIRQLNTSSVTVLNKNNAEKTLPWDASVDEVALLHVGKEGDVDLLLENLLQYVSPTCFTLPERMPADSCRQLRDALSGYKRLLICVTARKLDGLLPQLDALLKEPFPMPVVLLSFVSGKEAAKLENVASSADAMVQAHALSDDGQRHVVHLLYGAASADGRLSSGIGTAYALGDGITLKASTQPVFTPQDYGVDNRLLAQIDTIALEGIRKGAYPGCQVVVMKEGKMLYSKAFGTYDGTRPVTPNAVYDVASLTKTTATLLAVMKLYDTGRLNLTDRLGELLPWLKGTDKADITIRQLLLHESGLPSTIFFYQEAIDKQSYQGSLFKAKPDALHTVRIGAQTWANPAFRFKEGLTSPVQTDKHTLQVAENLWLNETFKADFRQKIATATLREKRYRYSCVGFILLQHVVEERTGMSLDAFLQQEFYGPMGLQYTGYLPLRCLPKPQVVPSNRDDFLRKGTLQGFVHDESAAFQGGVSGNAGLFSTAEEVAQVYQMLLNGGELNGRRYLGEETCRLFTTVTSRISRRGLGFDKPDSVNPAKGPCSPSTPAATYGHTGFTGTCAWVDPENKLVYVFLSNRLYSDVWNTKLMRLDIRPRIQEAVYKAIRKSK